MDLLVFLVHADIRYYSLSRNQHETAKKDRVDKKINFAWLYLSFYCVCRYALFLVVSTKEINDVECNKAMATTMPLERQDLEAWQQWELCKMFSVQQKFFRCVSF